MRRNPRRLLWLGISLFGMTVSSSALLGQVSSTSDAAAPATVDWSNYHVIFSRPATADQARKVEQDPRYWQQQNRRVAARLPEVETGAASRLDSRASAAVPGNDQDLSRDWSQDMGSGASVGAINYPAKYSFNTSVASCANDFVVYNTGLFGPAQASIVAYNNIYSSCGGTVASVYWAYNTGASVLTSPVFSRDGTQVAFVQRQSVSGQGIFLLVKWAASTTETIATPLTLTQVNRASYPTCTVPCKTGFPLVDLGTPAADTNSSVFYDYSADTAYVGDDAGFLHKFNPVFDGVPAEVKTGGWPVQVNPGAPTALTSPVHDYASGNVFVADTGGFLYLVDSAGAVTTSSQLDFSIEFDGGPGIVQGPIVDSTAGLVYVFATSDGSAGCAGGADCAGVFQFTTSFAGGDFGSEAVVGASSVEGVPPSPLYRGAFDSTYENSVNATGNLYVCGNTGGVPTLYQVALTVGGAFGTVNTGPALSTSNTPCSPVTDIPNPNVPGGATEWVFASAQAGGVSTGCASGGCIFNFKSTPWQPSTAYTVGQEVLDSHFQIQVVSIAGTSGTTAPSWSTLAGHTIHDHTVQWLDQGTATAVTPPSTRPSSTIINKGVRLLDNNGNIELVTKQGTSGATPPPVWNPTPGGTTSDGGVIWTNLGAIATAAAPEAGGTSGIVFDNTVETLLGASEVYFSTLSDQLCGTSVTPGGCAVQASQSALQ